MRSVVLLSGGIDSTVLLADLLHTGHTCMALSFDYGQLHHRELDAAHTIADHYGIDHRIIELPPIFGASALTGGLPMPHQIATAPDATLIPGRNLMLLSTAAAVADATGYGMVGFAGNQDDAAGYPDCRPHFIEHLRDAIVEGTQHHIWIHAPFLTLSKKQVVALGRDLNAPLSMTWSCYEGLAAGPCGRCGACLIREQAML